MREKEFCSCTMTSKVLGVHTETLTKDLSIPLALTDTLMKLQEYLVSGRLVNVRLNVTLYDAGKVMEYGEPSVDYIDDEDIDAAPEVVF